MPAKERKHILLVEDNGDDETLMFRALMKCGIEADVTVLRDGPEALDFLSGIESGNPKPALPDLVLLDLKLPQVDGISVLKAIRQNRHTRYPNVVILTSSREEKDLARCYDAGANSYLRKPADFEDFARLTGKICEYWLWLNERPGPIL